MAFKVTWQPVLQALALKEYHSAFADEVIRVCVNPRPEFWQERQTLMNNYSQRLVVVQAVIQQADAEAQQKSDEFSEWSEKEFVPGVRAWFARLWSFGEDKWTVEDVNGLDTTDPHLLSWLMTRSIEMINEHRLGRKKA